MNNINTPRTIAKQSLQHRITLWVKTHKKATIAIAATLATLLIAGGVYLALFAKQPAAPATAPVAQKPKPKPKPAPPPPKFYAPLTGLQVADAATAKKPITAIMIENSPSARPQSGMQAAEITYEAIAEGGITRFLNLYQQNKPGLIGPVRSLRPYYVDWLAPWQASVAHVGGSKRSLDEIRNGKYRDIDQFFNGGSYWRSRDRYAPHNVYTNFERLDALNASKGYTSSEPPAIVRDDIKKAETPAATNITVTMSSRWYNSVWLYDAASNSYHRQQAGAPHVDREAGQITADVVVVLRMNMNLVWEDGWRENYNSSGEGSAVVFQGGSVTEVVWRKPTTAEQLTFVTTDGKPFPLARGKLWVSAIPANQRGTVTWQ